MKYLLSVQHIASVIFFLLFSPYSAAGFDIKKPSSRDIFHGFGAGDMLKKKGEYIHHLLAVNFNYPFGTEGAWRNLQFQLEPFISAVSSPETNAELGCVFFIKGEAPWNFPLKPYIRGGSGVILLFQETEELSTMLNCASQLGYGVSYNLKNIRISLEYRNRHISNAGIKQPNAGIDTYMWLLGIGGLF